MFKCVSLHKSKSDDPLFSDKRILPPMESPEVLIKDHLLGYHLHSVALSHVISTLEEYSPFQVSMAIICNKLRYENTDKHSANINVRRILRQNNIEFGEKILNARTINSLISDICHCIWKYYNHQMKLQNNKLIILFDGISEDDFSFASTMYVYQAKNENIDLSKSINLNTLRMNLSTIIPSIDNCHPSLFILNTYLIDHLHIKSYFLRNGQILRFFPEHISTIWPEHFCIDSRDRDKLTSHSKFRHIYGLPLRDEEFCSIYYAITGRKFLSSHYYRTYKAQCCFTKIKKPDFHEYDEKEVMETIYEGKEEDDLSNTKTLKFPIFGGDNVDEWLMISQYPKFSNFEQELLYNSYNPLSMEHFKKLKKESLKICKSRQRNSYRLTLRETLALTAFTHLEFLRNVE